MDAERLEWLRWRKTGIGGSDAAAVHGKSPYLTRYGLWEDKSNPDALEERNSSLFELGNQLEILARVKFSALMRGQLGDLEATRVQMKELPFMIASLDGRSDDGRSIVEFKYQGVENHAKTAEGVVREHYRIQCQHQLLVSGADQCFFVSIDRDESLTFTRLTPDLEFMREHLAACAEFWERVISRRAPALCDQDFKSVRFKGAKERVQQWLRARRSLDALETELQEIEEDIISHVDPEEPRSICSGLKIFKTPDGFKVQR